MSLENKARKGDYERIVNENRVILNYNSEPATESKARVFRVRNKMPRLKGIVPIAILTLIGGGALAYAVSSYSRNAAEDKKAEAIINKEVVAYMDYNKNGRADASEKREFIYALLRENGVSARGLTLVDLARMAQEYSPKQ